MKLALIIFFNISFNNFFFSQSTFFKIFDLNPNTQYNSANDLKLLNNKIAISSTTFRNSGTNLLDATNITILNLDGIILNEIAVDSLSTLNRNENLLYLPTKLIVTGNLYPDTNMSSILEFDNELNKICLTKITGLPDRYYNNYGALMVGDYLYLYGILIPTINVKSASEARLVKLNYKSKQIIWERSYKLGNLNLECNDLQPTSDGNFAFILYFIPAAGAGPDEETYKIIKINSEGVVLDSFIYMDSNLQKNRLLTTKNGDFYFSSELHPINGWDWSTSGRINKLNRGMDKLEWNLILPNNALTDGRMYQIEDYIEARNGDIVICGKVRENSDSKVPGGDLSTTWNGFIVRLNSDGKIIWLRIYRFPQEILDKSQYGQFRPSILKKIVELESGDFIAFGDLFYNNRQASSIDPKKYETNHLLLLRVNETGCLDNYPCDTIIRLKPSVQNNTSKFNIGTTWTFETDEYVGGGNSIIKFRSIKITDTVNTNGKKIYALSSGSDSMYIEDDKMYFWDDGLKSYEMHFDFNSTSEYEIKYWDKTYKTIEIAKVKIDSTYKTYSGYDSVSTQLLNITISGNPSYNHFIEVYKNIGASLENVKLVLGHDLSSGPIILTKLRCFNSDSIENNFQDYPCDSAWVTTNTKYLYSDLIKLYPNPTLDNIKIHGFDNDLPFELFNINGEKISNGNTRVGIIELPFKGVFILKLMVKNQYYIEKIVRL